MMQHDVTFWYQLTPPMVQPPLITHSLGATIPRDEEPLGRHRREATGLPLEGDYVVLNYEGNPRRRQVEYIDRELRGKN